MDPTNAQKRAIEQVEARIRKDTKFYQHVLRFVAGETTKKEVLCARFNTIVCDVVREAGIASLKERNALKRYLRTYFNNLASGGTPEGLAVAPPATAERADRRPARW